MSWDAAGCERAVAKAQSYGMDFLEIALLDPLSVDVKHSRQVLEAAGMRAVCSLGLPQPIWASHNPDGAVEFLTTALDKCAAIGAEALSGVVYGGIGERTGQPPTPAELDNVTDALVRTAKHAKSLGLPLGIEPVNRYETHLLNTGWQAVEMIERIGLDNMFVHLDTYHMNIEEKGIAQGIVDAREHLRYIHLSESDRGTPGAGTIAWDEVFGALRAVGFKGGLAMESFVNMPPEIASGLSVWRPVASGEAEVMGNGLPFLRNKARQYGLI
ncbi:sugar phosphate isomerase/epimerase family protein [Tateyamaria omphalii]|uniref:sugar phosphate isomerase/epimerase family protein n=1 Tax=Tateyamaria omphalii TaxID=299262 RepID=UPI0021BDD5C9|nr:sugar phosphate isomerase/epimerase family protein [Tateyamaria omphalii]